MSHSALLSSVAVATFALIGTAATADQVINDDLIVIGSICAGFDCVNGEDFGFDTLRLKENNTRMQFNDTSVGSFPTNNWQIRANSSSNGGPNFLGFVDQGATGTSESGTIVFSVAANAGANALFVNAGGNVGFGNGSPVVKLHATNGNTPTLRLEQNSSSGFTPQTWDVAGNEANFFLRDATFGSRLVFRVQPNAPSNSIFVAAPSGNVGLGTAAPAENLHIKGTNDDTVAIELENNTTWRIRNQGAAGATDGWLEFRNADVATTIPMRIAANANNNLLLVGAADAATADSDRVSITGELFINGVNNSNPDYVFEPDYALESIEEHAAFMWTNKHLPAVGGGVNDQNGKAVINVANRSQGVLEELEKAHIYIEQLNKRLAMLEVRLAASE